MYLRTQKTYDYERNVVGHVHTSKVILLRTGLKQQFDTFRKND